MVVKKEEIDANSLEYKEDTSVDLEVAADEDETSSGDCSLVTNSNGRKNSLSFMLMFGALIIIGIYRKRISYNI